MVGMKSKISNKYMSVKIPIKIRQALMRQIWSHQRIIDKNQGSSKEIGYQLKETSLICIGFQVDKSLMIYTHKETCTYKMVREKGTRYPKGSHKYTNEIVA